MDPTSSATKLEDLLMKEVSSVDDPANQLPGFAVIKASAFKTGYPVGPDETWDVGAAEGRIRQTTDAVDGPNPRYASCFLWYDGSADDPDGDGVPDRFGDYKFLVCDVVNGKVSVMPAAVRATASRLPGSSLSPEDKDAVGALVKKLEQKAGIGAGAKSREGLVEKIKGLLRPTNDSREEIDVTQEEFEAGIAKALEPVQSAVESLVAKSVETPTGSETETPDPDSVAKAIEAGIAAAVEPRFEQYNEILEKVLDRLEGVEKGTAVRKSLPGQENGPAPTNEKPTVKDAIVRAFRGSQVVPVAQG